MSDDKIWPGTTYPAEGGETWDSTAPPARTDALAGEVRRYVRNGVLGSGGMGVVYAAEDGNLIRQVALKVAHDASLGRRMEREARITAQLEHPGIVPVYDAGQGEDGRPWYTMRLIRGRSLGERLREAGDLPARLRLIRPFLAACQAVAYAHSKGIIHRDLKPDNVLVGEFGETQVADWGLACPTREARERWTPLLPSSGSALTTQPGAIMGTPATMSPEQARGEGASEGSDVWALGTILFEILVGRPAFIGDTGAAVLAQVRSGAVPDPEVEAPGAPQELTAIVRKALQQEPADRYPDAGALARDVARFLDGQQVSAHAYTTADLMKRALRIWRVPIAVGAIALVLIATVAAVAGLRNADERARAQAAEAEAREALQRADANLSEVLVQQAIAAIEADARPEAEILAAHALIRSDSPDARGVLAAWAGAPRPVRLERWPLPPSCTLGAKLSPDALRLLCPSRGGLQVWDPRAQRLLWERKLDVSGADWLDAERVAAASRSGDVQIFDASGGREHLFILPGARKLTLGPDGDSLLMGTEGELIHVDLGTGAIEHHAVCPSTASALLDGPGLAIRRCSDGTLRRYRPDGSLVDRRDVAGLLDWATTARNGDVVVAGDFEGNLVWMDLGPDGQTHATSGFDGAVSQAVALQDTGLVVVRGERGGPRLWDTATNGWLGTLTGRASHMAAGVNPGEIVLLTDAVELWQIPLPVRPWAIPTGAGISALQVSPAGDRLTWSHGSGVVGVVDLNPWRTVQRLQWQDGVVKGTTFTSDGRYLFASGMRREGGTVFDTETWTEHQRIVPSRGFTFRRVGGLHPGLVWGLAYAGGAAIWDPETGAVVQELSAEGFFEGASSPDQRHATVLAEDGGIWTLGPGPTVERIGQDDTVEALDISSDGARVLLGRPYELCLLSTRGDAPLICHPVEGRVRDVALSPDDTLAAAASLSGVIHLIDLETGATRARLHGHTARGSAVEFHPTRPLLFSGSWDGTVRQWDLSRLDQPPARLVRELESAWGMSLESALQR